MKKVYCTIVAMVLLPLSLFAGLAVPGEANPVLATEKFELNGQQMTVEKRIDSMNLTLRVLDADGKQIFSSETLGSEEKLFVIDREATSLKARDLNGDKVPELMAAAFYGPNASGLYIFAYDAAAKTFKPMQFVHAAADLTRDCLVSDMRQENGEDLMFLSDDVVRALGMIYSTEPDVEPVAGFYFYKLTDGAFKFIESKPVPVDE
jgi:hypothetical protein